MSCPNCNSTDVADLVDSGRTCLDCNWNWLPKVHRLHMSPKEIRQWRKKYTNPQNVGGCHAQPQQ